MEEQKSTNISPEKVKIFFMTSAVMSGLVDTGYYAMRSLFLEDPQIERVKNVDEADVIAFSCGAAFFFPLPGFFGKVGTFLGDAIKNFKQSDNKLVVVGGNISKSPAPVERYVDVFCVGHAFTFIPVFRELLKQWKFDKKPKSWILSETVKQIKNAYVPDIQRRKYDPLNLKYSYVEGFPRIPYDHFFDWKYNKLVQYSESSFACVATIGCKRKCNFCQVGWFEKWSEEDDVNKILYYHEKIGGSHISWISDNLADWKLAPFITTSSSSASVKSFQKTKHMSRIIRTGIEGYSERLRRLLGKPISWKEIEDLIMANKSHQFKLFHIDGVPFTKMEDIDEFVDFWGRDFGGYKGRLMFKFTYFNPIAGTPMGWMPPLNYAWIGDGMGEKIYNEISRRGNKRARFMHASTSVRGYLRNVVCVGNGYIGSIVMRSRDWSRLVSKASRSGNPEETLSQAREYLERNKVYDLELGWLPGEWLPSEMIDNGVSREIILKMANDLESEVQNRGTPRHPEKRSALEDYKYLEEIPGIDLSL